MESVEAVARRRHSAGLTFFRKVLLSLLGLGVIGAIVGGSMQGTHSTFTASAANQGNSFAAGTLTMTNNNNNGTTCSNAVVSQCGAVQFSTGHLQPGAVYTQTITITNAGTLPATMSLQIANVVDVSGTLAAFTNFTIHDDTKNACLFGTGVAPACASLANLTTASYPLSTAASSYALAGTTRSDSRWAPSESHNVTFSVEIETTDCAGFLPVAGATPNPTPIGTPTAASSCDARQTTFDILWTAVQ